MDTVTKEFLAIKFKRKQDKSIEVDYAKKSIEVAQKQNRSVLMGLQAVAQVKGWKVQPLTEYRSRCPTQL